MFPGYNGEDEYEQGYVLGRLDIIKQKTYCPLYCLLFCAYRELSQDASRE